MPSGLTQTEIKLVFNVNDTKENDKSVIFNCGKNTTIEYTKPTEETFGQLTVKTKSGWGV